MDVLRDAMSQNVLEEPVVYLGMITVEVYTSMDEGESWKKIASGLGRI